jgi:hypothetical protein
MPDDKRLPNAELAKQFFTLGWEDAFAGKPPMTLDVSDDEFARACLNVYLHGFEAGQCVKPLFPDDADKARDYEYTESNCPGHVASPGNSKICDRCGVHVDAMR